MSTSQRIGLTMMLLGIHWMVGAGHSQDSTATLWTCSVLFTIVGGAMLMAPWPEKKPSLEKRVEELEKHEL